MRGRWASALLAVLLVSLTGPIMVGAEKATDALDSIGAEWPGVQTELLEVRRMSDNTVRVRWRWRNTTDQKVHLYSSDGGSTALKQSAYLIDPKNKKKHLVVADTQGKPVGTALAWLDLAPKQALAVWAKFPAPPADVDKITVVIPHTPPFEDVALK